MFLPSKFLLRLLSRMNLRKLGKGREETGSKEGEREGGQERDRERVCF